MENVNTQGLVRGVTYDTEPEKTYLILLDGVLTNDEETIFRDWEFKVGRQEAYDYIKDMLQNQYAIINVHNSKIIVDSTEVTIKQGISIYKFMKNMKENEKVIDYSSFDIEDYVTGETEGAE